MNIHVMHGRTLIRAHVHGSDTIGICIQRPGLARDVRSGSTRCGARIKARRPGTQSEIAGRGVEKHRRIRDIPLARRQGRRTHIRHRDGAAEPVAIGSRRSRVGINDCVLQRSAIRVNPSA